MTEGVHLVPNLKKCLALCHGFIGQRKVELYKGAEVGAQLQALPRREDLVKQDHWETRSSLHLLKFAAAQIPSARTPKHVCPCIC
jgi:hypothetical protein